MLAAIRLRLSNGRMEGLDEVTNRWGIKVTAVEIREITPPREILEAMTRQILAVAQTVDAKTMSLQYLETLKSLGASASTMLLIPMEFTSLLRPILEHATQSSNSAGRGEGEEKEAPAAH